MLEKCKDCCSRLFCMSVAEVNGEDFETMANKKDCRKRVVTNADCIRAMNDKMLAEFLGDWAQRHRVWMCDSQGECLAWLQEPAKEEE